MHYVILVTATVGFMAVLWRWRLSWGYSIIDPRVWASVSFFFFLFVKAFLIDISGSPLVEHTLGTAPSDGAITYGVITATLGSVFALLPIWGRALNSGTCVPPEAGLMRGRRVVTACLVAAIVGIGIRYYIFWTNASVYFTNAGFDKDEMMRNIQGVMYVTIIYSALINVGIITLLVKWRTLNWLGRAVCTALVVHEAVFFLLSGSRSAIMVFLVLVMLAVYAQRPSKDVVRGRRFIVGAVSIVIVGLLMYIPLSIVRFADTSRDLGEKLRDELNDRRYMDFVLTPVRDRLNAFDTVLLVEGKVPQFVDFSYFEEMKVLLYAPIPRALWPEKPTISFGKRFSQDFLRGYYAENTAAAVSLVGHGYLALGILGVAVICLLYGIFIRAICRVAFRLGPGWSPVLLICMVPSVVLLVEQDAVALVSTHIPSLLVTAGVVVVVRKLSF